MRAGLALVAVLLLAGCGGSKDTAPAQTTPTPQVASPFDYDASPALRFQDGGRVNSGDYPIAIHDVSYLSRGERVEAYLAIPPGKERRPAVIFLHGSGGDRSQMLLSATWMAGRGALTLTITAPSTGVAGIVGATPLEQLRQERNLAVADVVAVRRAIDLLGERADVDRDRIGFLGWSSGARAGAILAGVEPRLQALVLMSGGAAPISEYIAQIPVALRPPLEPILRSIDPLGSIADAKPERLLLQLGSQDEVVPLDALEAMVAAAPQGTEVRRYAAGHGLNGKALKEQLAWLSQKLDAGPDVKGARIGP